jgi:hypothetical protein
VALAATFAIPARERVLAGARRPAEATP